MVEGIVSKIVFRPRTGYTTLGGESRHALKYVVSLLRRRLDAVNATDAQRRVALVGIHLHVSIDVLTFAVDEVFTSESVCLVKQFVGSKAVGIDGH